jgi:hypothetical protein
MVGRDTGMDTIVSDYHGRGGSHNSHDDEPARAKDFPSGSESKNVFEVLEI